MKSIIITLLLTFSNHNLYAQNASLFGNRQWTSSDGRTIEASFVSVTEKKVTIKLAKGAIVHTLDLDKLSQEDRDFVSSKEEEAIKIVKSHNEKVQSFRWNHYWYSSRDLITVPELELDELLLIFHFGLLRDLQIFAVKFTPNKFKIDNNKLTALVMGNEGFAVQVKADDDWNFSLSNDKLNVRPKVLEKGSSDKAETVYSFGVGERLLFPNGRSISAGDFGLNHCLILSLDNFEPRKK
jgi:hypothetical protein